MGAGKIFPKGWMGGGQKHQHRKKLSSFRRAVKQTDNVFCAPVALRNILLFVASAEGASETFRVFRMRAAYDVIFFKFQGEGESTPFVPPLWRLWLLPDNTKR